MSWRGVRGRGRSSWVFFRGIERGNFLCMFCTFMGFTVENEKINVRRYLGALMDTCSSTIKKHALPYLLPLRYLCCSLLKSRLRRISVQL